HSNKLPLAKFQDKISAYNKIVKSQGNLFGHISKQNLTCNIFVKAQRSLRIEFPHTEKLLKLKQVFSS
uniref:hypothetical protein n=1 Tax=Klebsiella pneumoniae TaxID=573 RepID=UPI001BB1D0D6